MDDRSHLGFFHYVVYIKRYYSTANRKRVWQRWHDTCAGDASGVTKCAHRVCTWCNYLSCTLPRQVRPSDYTDNWINEDAYHGAYHKQEQAISEEACIKN